MTQSHVAPPVGPEIRELQLRSFPLGDSAESADHSFDFIVQQQHVVSDSRLWVHLRRWPDAARYREHRKIAVAEMDSLRFTHHHSNPERLEQSQDADGLARTWSVVVARDHHYHRVWKHLDETRKLPVRIHYCGVGRANAVKYVAPYENEVRLQLDRLV